MDNVQNCDSYTQWCYSDDGVIAYCKILNIITVASYTKPVQSR
jgi:hypothetical protein